MPGQARQMTLCSRERNAACRPPRLAAVCPKRAHRMTAIDYEAEYNNRARVPEHPQIFARWATDSASYRAGLPASRQARISYGATAREVIDLFDARSNAPLAVFIHGGWWRNFDPSLFSHLAAGLNAHGIGVAVPGYNLCPHVKIADIINEMRRA